MRKSKIPLTINLKQISEHLEVISYKWTNEWTNKNKNIGLEKKSLQINPYALGLKLIQGVVAEYHNLIPVLSLFTPDNNIIHPLKNCVHPLLYSLHEINYNTHVQARIRSNANSLRKLGVQ